jgi:hypothetical protein
MDLWDIYFFHPTISLPTVLKEIYQMKSDIFFCPFSLQDNLDDVTQRFDESSKPISFHPNRPRSTYGNRSLSTNHNEDRHYDREHGGKDWVPKIVLVDSQKLESSSEHDSGSVSADRYAMQYVKNGDRVLFELSVDGM